MSYLPALDCEGTCSPYKRSADAQPEDALLILAASNITHVRVRIWNDPVGPYLNDTYANLTHVAHLAKRIKAAGLSLWLDFHYSDTWADPSHQFKPAAWLDEPASSLAGSVYSFTQMVLTTLQAQGTPPAIVQVGNEIDAGMLWNASDQPCSDGAAIWPSASSGCTSEGQWKLLGSIVGAGLKACRDVLGRSVTTMIHISKGSMLGLSYGAKVINMFYTNFTNYGASDFDAIGLSFYPHWGAGNTSNARNLAGVHAAFPTKQLILAETAFPFMPDCDPGSEFACTPQGQLEYIQSLISNLRATPGAAGVAWWGGEYYNQKTGAGHTALFDQNAVALPALLYGFS